MPRVVLISTYEMGRQPFGPASAAAWLKREGARVCCLDLSRQELDEAEVERADLIALYVPMHTATRLAAALTPRLRKLNPQAKLCFYGLYAPLNRDYLESLGADYVLGGEFEQPLAELVRSLAEGVDPAPAPAAIHLAKLRFIVPDRAGLPPLPRYAPLRVGGGERRVAGYTEASRGCKHMCRHCPITPVYQGAFRVVQREVVLEDIRRQVAAGARHITFGDPDFFNAPKHAVELVEAMHREHPQLSYDATIKIEHLLRHSRHIETLRRTGCVLVVSAVESLDDRVLRLLDKGHTRRDFLRVAERFGESHPALSPTFMPFTPWTSLDGYRELLSTLREMDLVDNVAPIQLAIRLLIPAGSRLLELPDVLAVAEPFDNASLSHGWKHADPRIDQLCEKVQGVVRRGERTGASRTEIFSNVWAAAFGASPAEPILPARSTIPYLEEPWYC